MNEAAATGHVWSIVEAGADRDPAGVAVVAGERRVSFVELRRAAERVAARLPSDGPRRAARDARVLISSREPLRILERVLGAWSAGFVPAVLHEGTGEAKLSRALERLRPVATLLGDEPEPEAGALQDWPRLALDSAREGLVLSTSGSSGEPKLFAVPMRTLRLHAQLVADLVRLTPADRLLVPTPLSHSHGLVGGVMAGLLAGAEVHIFRAGRPAPVLQGHMRRVGITVVQGLPSFFRLFFPYWNGTPFPSLRVVSVGGEPTSAELAQKMAAAFPAAERVVVYGLAEAGTRLAQIGLDDPRALRGAVGRLLPHFEAQLRPVDEADTLPAGSEVRSDRVPGADVGELAVRGPTVFLGYLGSDGGYTGLDAEGFLRTRDLVRIDADGYLYPLGRLDALFKVGGRLVNPLEVEAAARGVPGVAEVLCRPAPHPLLGHVPGLEVVPAVGADPEAVQRGVVAACERELESWKRPPEIRIVAALPRGATGKVQRAPAAGSSGS